MTKKITHVGFSDESNWNCGRFRSISLVTTKIECVKYIQEELRMILGKAGRREFKWANVKGFKSRNVAEEMYNLVIRQAYAKNLRVDVLIWDIEDQRHKIEGRDDIENLQRMYYHLFRNVLRMRWPDDAVWRLYPDEHTAMDRQSVRDCLSAVSTHVEIERSSFTGGKFSLRLKREFGIEDIVEATSRENPLPQVADLFAGLAVFSRDKFKEYEKWLQDTSIQCGIFADQFGCINLSNRTLERFRVLQGFDNECKRRKMGVSLKTSCGLRTRNPGNPINLWL